MVIGIAFHGVGEPRRQLENGEHRYWVTPEQLRSFLECVTTRLNPQSIHISFDDGNISDHKIALPMLLDRGLVGEFFVLTGRIGLPGSLGPTELRELVDAGMSVGSHGVNHFNWRDLGLPQLMAEVVDSRARLEDICGTAITSASIPFGRYNNRVLTALKVAGYRRILTSDGGPVDPTCWIVPRTNIRADTTNSAFADLVANRESISRRLRREMNRLRKRIL